MRAFFAVIIVISISAISGGCGLLDSNVDILAGMVATTAAIQSDLGNGPATGATPEVYTTPKIYTRMIRRSSGGEIVFEGLKLTFPANSVAIDTIVRVTHFKGSGHGIPDSETSSFTGFYKLEPAGLLLENPAELELKGSGDEISGAPSRPALAIFRFDGESWQPLRGSGTSSSAKASIDCFSIFRLYGNLTASQNVAFDEIRIFKGLTHLGADVVMASAIGGWGDLESFGVQGTQMALDRNPAACVKHMAILWEVSGTGRKLVSSRHVYTIALIEKWWHNYEQDVTFNPGSWRIDPERFLEDSGLFSMAGPRPGRDGSGMVVWHQFEVSFDSIGNPVVHKPERQVLANYGMNTWKSLFRLPGKSRAFHEISELSNLDASKRYVLQLKSEVAAGTDFNPVAVFESKPFSLFEISQDPVMNSTASISSPSSGEHSQGEVLAFKAKVDSSLGEGYRQLSWSSSRDGLFGTAFEFSYGSLSAGQHIVTLRVEDLAGGFAESRIYLDITPGSPGNLAPRIISAPVTDAVCDRSYHYNVTAEDPENSALVFSLTAAPAGMTIEASSGLISWIPAHYQVGENSVTVSVADRWKAGDLQTFAITVKDPMSDTVPPFLAWVSPLEGESVAGRIELRVSASDNEWLTKVKFHLESSDGKIFLGSREEAPFVAVWDTTGYADGKWKISATAIDKGLNKTVKTIEVTITN